MDKDKSIYCLDTSIYFNLYPSIEYLLKSNNVLDAHISINILLCISIESVIVFVYKGDAIKSTEELLSTILSDLNGKEFIKSYSYVDFLDKYRDYLSCIGEIYTFRNSLVHNHLYIDWLSDSKFFEGVFENTDEYFKRNKLYRNNVDEKTKMTNKLGLHMRPNEGKKNDSLILLKFYIMLLDFLSTKDFDVKASYHVIRNKDYIKDFINKNDIWLINQINV